MTKYQVDVLIVGAGPAGIFTAIELERKKPGLKILIIDKGVEIDKRKCPEKTKGYCIKCPVCSITSGWSGAGAFSDGKLSLSTDVGGRITEYLGQKASQDLIDYADTIYLEFGANNTVYGLNNSKTEDIAYEASKYDLQLIACPVRHLGTEKAFTVLKAMHDYLVAKDNVEFWSLTRAEDLLVENNVAVGAKLRRGNKEFIIEAKKIVVAPGRGGAEWLNEQTNKLNIQTENNEVDVGVRVEVPNSIMDHLTKDLYEAKLVYYSDTYDNKVRTFCMNPGGVVSGESYEGISVVNGHSYSDQNLRTQNTNFALLVSTKFTKPFNEPIEYGKYVARLANMLTGGGIMVQRLGDLLKGRRSDYSRLEKSSTIPTLKSAVPGDLSYVLPARYLTSIVEALKALDKIAPGLYSRNTLLYGVEVKFYSSKVKLDNNFETEVKNLYTIGDGAGITRGLMQASVNGISVARDLAKVL
ncbi:MAG: FAD-binding protein [Eubacteriales bacterium]|jgi:uncharacterized FAD-dependent dehydrogenase|nr:FAD-binding protein [Eubacteriales bacterium]